jgi:4-hydroxyphenylacetate 3-monooxygenase
MGAMRIEAFVEQPTGRVAQHFVIRRMYNFGSATRDPGVAVAHQQEVAHSGIHIALSVPAPRIYPIASHAIATADEVFVHNEETSGEVEIVVIEADRLYVGVGSDHTDRALERTSILWSKQACPNVLAPVLWPWDDVAAIWDDCVLRAWVDGRLYQEVAAGKFLSPPDMLRTLRERVAGVPARDVVVFGGTIVALDKKLGFGAHWQFALTAPDGREIRHAYHVTNILDEVREGFRVPMENPKPAMA